MDNYLKWRKKPPHQSPQPECETTGRSHQVDTDERGEEESVTGHGPCRSRGLGPAHTSIERARHAIVETGSCKPQDGVEGGDRKVDSRQPPSQDSSLPPEVDPE